MEKINDKKESSRKFQCVHCEEKPFTTKQNLLRHMTRKHKNVFETEAGINTALGGSKTPPQANDSPPVDSSIEGLSPQTSKTPNIDMLNEYLETQSETETEPEPIPNDGYLIHLRNEYNKYKHLYTSIDNRIRWEKANSNIDMDFYVRRHNTKMKYILFKIALLNCNI